MKVFAQNKDPDKPEDQNVFECDRVIVEELDGVVMVNLYEGKSKKPKVSIDP